MYEPVVLFLATLLSGQPSRLEVEHLASDPIRTQHHLRRLDQQTGPASLGAWRVPPVFSFPLDTDTQSTPDRLDADKLLMVGLHPDTRQSLVHAQLIPPRLR